MSSAPAEPSAIERPLQAPSRAERRRAAISISTALASPHLERPSRAKGRRAWKRQQLRCFRAAKPGNVERPGDAERVRAAISSASGAERARAPISSAPAEPSRRKLETSAGAVFSYNQAEQFRAPLRSRAGSSGHFERPSGVEPAWAAISSAPTEPSGFDVTNVGRCGVFEQPGRAIKPWIGYKPP